MDTRTWTATVKIHGYQPADAPLSDGDLQAAQIRSAVTFAKQLMTETGRDMATVTIKKTTKAHGTKTDKHLTVSTDGTRYWVQ